MKLSDIDHTWEMVVADNFPLVWNNPMVIGASIAVKLDSLKSQKNYDESQR